MNVVVCPSDQTGCGKYRMIWPAEALQAQGANVTVQKRPRILVNQAIKPAEIQDVLIQDADVIVFQRPASYQIAQMIPILHKKGIKVVIDMDDDLSTIHPINPSYSFYRPDINPHRNWELAQKACDMADMVTVTTPALADKYGKHGRVAVIPNCIPDSYLKIESTKNNMVTVGWPGWVATHPEDLQVTHGAINEALVKQNARFMVIGDKRAFDKLGIKNRAPHIFHEGVEMDVYPETVSQLDIGIVPLADTPFNHAKSLLKALEYAALGVAPVVSPTPDNMRMVNAGAAYVASSPREWRDIVRSLIIDEGERTTLAKSARNFASIWTIEANAWRWWAVWNQT